jgi:sugar transferase (PEP-CTERM/EpsH1 system associated)
VLPSDVTETTREEADGIPARPRAGGVVDVVQLVLTLDVGGLEMMVLDYVRRAHRDRFRHHVICLRGPGELSQRFEAAGISVTALGATGRLPALVRLVRLLKRSRPHVVHTHNAGPNWYAAAARFLTPVPALVHTKHGRNLSPSRRLARINRWASMATDAVVSVSADAAEEIRGREGIAPCKVVVIHNGIDLTGRTVRPPEPRPALRAISVARLNVVKDQRTLLRAVRLVVDRHPAFRLDLVGDGSERGALEGLRRDLGLEAHVRFVGYREDVQALLQESDVFALTSRTEGLALTLLEAMAAGLPVVATDVGGNREVVARGETGLLVAAGSPTAVAEALLSLIDDPARAAAMGRAGRQRVERLFDIRTMVARYETLYDALLAGQGIPPL